MKHETFTCDSQHGMSPIEAVHHVTVDGPEGRTVDLCDACMADGLRLLLNTLTEQAQAAWLATVLKGR